MSKDKKQKLQRNAYLDKLGIPIKYYGVNYLKDDSYRKKLRKKYGFDDRETLNLYRTFAEWLHSHCKMYLEVAPVKLDYHTFQWRDKELTQKQALKKIIKWTGMFLKGIYESEHVEFISFEEENKLFTKLEKATQLFGIILGAMWW